MEGKGLQAIPQAAWVFGVYIYIYIHIYINSKNIYTHLAALGLGCSMQDLSSLSRYQTQATALGAQSLKHRTTEKSLAACFTTSSEVCTLHTR